MRKRQACCYCFGRILLYNCCAVFAVVFSENLEYDGKISSFMVQFLVHLTIAINRQSSSLGLLDMYVFRGEIIYYNLCPTCDMGDLKIGN